MAGENGEFDYEQWANEHKLSKKTLTTLKKEECESLDSLRLVTSKDVNRMNIAVGQIRILRKALRVLGNPITIEDDTSQVSKSVNQEAEQHLATPREAEQDEAEEGNIQALHNAGRDLEQLLGAEIGESDSLQNKEGSRGDQSRWQPRRLDPGYDPLMLLTVKATGTKALKIVYFLPEAAKARVTRRRRDHITFATSSEGGLSLKAEEPGSYYITMDEWLGANMRLGAQLLKNGSLRGDQLIYYMAYTAMIADLAAKFEWASILEFDTRYRELQAEHEFEWGTQHPHTERHLLTPRRTLFNNKGKGPVGWGEKPQGKKNGVQPVCKEFVARGWCRFGKNCDYRHETAPRPEVEKTSPKNE